MLCTNFAAAMKRSFSSCLLVKLAPLLRCTRHRSCLPLRCSGVKFCMMNVKTYLLFRKHSAVQMQRQQSAMFASKAIMPHSISFVMQITRDSRKGAVYLKSVFQEQLRTDSICLKSQILLLKTVEVEGLWYLRKQFSCGYNNILTCMQMYLTHISLRTQLNMLSVNYWSDL